MSKVVMYDEERFSSILKTTEAYLLTNEEYLDKEEIYRIKDDIIFLQQCLTFNPEKDKEVVQHGLFDYLDAASCTDDDDDVICPIVDYITPEHFTEAEVMDFCNMKHTFEEMDERIICKVCEVCNHYIPQE